VRARLGTLAGLRLGAHPSAGIASLVLWSLATDLAVMLLHQPFVLALGIGLLVVALHWASAIWHQLGHAWVARRVGHPMIGLDLWLLLSTALYPMDEPELPAGVHISRALGGPLASLALTLLSGLLLLVARTEDGVLWWVLVFLFLDNLLVFTLGALLPLGFTDGSTLLRWLRRR